MVGQDSGGQRIKSVEIGFNIIEQLEKLDGARVSELADHLDIPKSTAHVYLSTLHGIGYVIKDGHTYRPSLRFLERGGYVRQNIELYRAARPRVDELSTEIGEVVNVGVEENGKRVLIYSSESPHGVFDNSPTGQFTHMHWTALGKSILANLPEKRTEQIVDQHGLPKATANTIINRVSLFAELDHIRHQGFATEDEERRDGIKAIGVPVFSEDGDVLGAVSISGPKNRINSTADDVELAEQLKEIVNVIELQVQHY